MGPPGPKHAGRGLRAEVITVGSELVQGLVTDAHSAWISSRLADIGIPTDYHTSVGDDVERVAALVRQAVSRSDVVMVAGGLGPTADDITREAVAHAAGKPLVLHQPSLDVIAAMFARWGRGMSENNRSQAFIPEGADVMPNRRGTAPGFIVQMDEALVFVFPGPPHELHAMVEDLALPHLRSLQTVPEVLRLRRIHCFGVGESQVDEKIRHLMSPDRNPSVGLLVSGYVITVKIAARAASTEAADVMIAETEGQVRSLLGDIVFGTDEETMGGVVARELIARGLTIALAESCTGGMIAEWLTRVSGISRSFLAGVVSYSNDAKREMLGVPTELLETQGAVSEPVARAMAEGVRTRTGADVSVAVTGIAGPTGGTPEKPVGLVYIARADADGVDVRECRFHGSRQRIRCRTGLAALDMVRRWMHALPE